MTGHGLKRGPSSGISGASRRSRRRSEFSTGLPSVGTDSRRNAKKNLMKWLKDMAYRADREYGVYMAFIIVPEPGVEEEPKV